MLQIVSYTLEAGVIFAIFTVIYNNVYYGIGYNKWERFYLLFSTIASYILPKLKMEYVERPTIKTPDKIVEIIDRNNGIDTVILSREQNFSTSITDFFHTTLFDTIVEIIFIVYLIGIAVKTTTFVISIKKTLSLKRNPRLKTIDNINVYQTQVSTVAFSFFNNIFLGTKTQKLTENELQIVVNHELQHIKGFHSLDTIVFAMFSIIQWFNPMVRKAAQMSRIVCENIADSPVSADNVTEYSELLLKISSENKTIKISNKKKNMLFDRLARLLNTDTEKIKRIRFATALPIIIIAITSYIVLCGLLIPNDNRFQSPIKGKYKIIATYFENQKLGKTDGNIYIVSHRQTEILTKSKSKIISPFDGKIQAVTDSSITISNNKISVIFDGFTAQFSIGQTIKHNQTIGNIDENEILNIIVINNNGTKQNPELYLKL